jgi:hypothetical protein
MAALKYKLYYINIIDNSGLWLLTCVGKTILCDRMHCFLSRFGKEQTVAITNVFGYFLVRNRHLKVFGKQSASVKCY